MNKPCKYIGTGKLAERCMGTKEIDPCVGYDKCKRYEPNYITNADRIRAMSDEELAMIIMCPYGIEGDLCNKRTDRLTCCVQWLKQPAKDSK